MEEKYPLVRGYELSYRKVAINDVLSEAETREDKKITN